MECPGTRVDYGIWEGGCHWKFWKSQFLSCSRCNVLNLLTLSSPCIRMPAFPTQTWAIGEHQKNIYEQTRPSIIALIMTPSLFNFQMGNMSLLGSINSSNLELLQRSGILVLSLSSKPFNHLHHLEREWDWSVKTWIVHLLKWAGLFAELGLWINSWSFKC